MSAVSQGPFEPHDEDRKFLRTLAQLARLDPRMRVKEDESDLVHDALARAIKTYGADALAAMSQPRRRGLLRKVFNSALVDLVRHYHGRTHDIGREQLAQARVDESFGAWEKNAAAQQTTPSEAAMREERFAQVAIALQSLPENQRLVVQNKFFLDRTLNEVADLLGMSLNRVLGYYTRGMKRLAELLRDLESQS